MTTSSKTMLICAEAEIVMWIRRFCRYRRRLSSIQTQQQLRYIKLLRTQFDIIFHHFNTQYHDVPPHSHHPNHLSPSYAQSSSSFQFKPPTDRFKSPSSPYY